MEVVSIVAVSAVALLLAAAGAYNGLAALRQDVRDAWGAMDAELRRRGEAVAPLVAAARAAGAGEAVSAVLAAKNRAAVAFSPEQLAAAEGELTGRLRDLFAAPPPSLAAAPAFARARADLVGAEGRIGTAGRRYNAAVHAYNVARAGFPLDVAAAVFGFQPQPTFDLPHPAA